LQIGTIAGNLAMKHEHNEFPSDMYLMLETVGATLNVGEFNYDRRKLSMHFRSQLSDPWVAWYGIKSRLIRFGSKVKHIISTQVASLEIPA
jgi:hypothetical protein